MTTALTHLGETGLGQSSNDLGTADDRQRRAHAESWTVAMIGGSMASGSASSSKYSSSASRRLARASSVVRPWLVTSTSRARATYHPSSCVTAAVNCTTTTLRRRGSRRGQQRLTKLLVRLLASPASRNANLEPLVEGAGDHPGRPPRQGPPGGVLGVRGIHRVATTAATTPASTVASPERRGSGALKVQRVATPPPPVANPDSLGLFS
jgi:hypothetical protein